MTEEELANYLKPNSYTDLDKEDYFGIKPKAEIIKMFLNTLKIPLTFKMFALYGDWGSGKTSVMKWLDSEFNKSNCKVIFFEAWKYEKDSNIALSLLDVIITEAKTTKRDFITNLLKWGAILLASTAKSIKIKTPIVDFDMNIFQGSLDKVGESIETSFVTKMNEFEKEFSRVEECILSNESQKLIIFIDDLDRCEPENVLNLLSAIKLFFTYSKRTLYFCGLDKNAVSKAVEVKYGECIDADEYLEKIFDISFYMPRLIVVNKLINYHFETSEIANKISWFFNEIDFTNPRSIKKVMNKYHLVRYFKDNAKTTTFIPDLTLPNALFNNILVLLIIVLYEFYLRQYLQIKDYEIKLENYTLVFAEQSKMDYEKAKSEVNFYTIVNKHQFRFEHYSSMLAKLPDMSKERKQEIGRQAILTLFTPVTIDRYIPIGYNTTIEYVNQFEDNENKILVRFCKFLLNNMNLIEENNCSCGFYDLIRMAETVL